MITKKEMKERILAAIENHISIISKQKERGGITKELETECHEDIFIARSLTLISKEEETELRARLWEAYWNK